MIEELERKLNSITGDDPISNMRRMRILEQIFALMDQGAGDEGDG